MRYAIAAVVVGVAVVAFTAAGAVRSGVPAGVVASYAVQTVEGHL